MPIRLKSFDLSFLRSTEINAILVKDVMASVFLVLSIFFPYMKWVLVSVLIVYMLIELNINSFAHILFFSSGFPNILHLSILLGIYVLIQALIFLTKILIREEKLFKFDYIFISMTVIFYVYVLIFAVNKISFSLVYFATIGLMYIIYKEKEKVNFKILIRCFIYGVLFLYAISIFTLLKDQSFFYHNEVLRFQAFLENPNAFYIFTTVALSFWMFLYLKNEVIEYEFLTGYFILNCISILTLSKTSLLIVFILNFVFISYLLYKNKNNKIILTFLIAIAVLFPYIENIFSRFVGGSINIGVKVENDNDLINEITTGRSSIYIFYIKEIFSSPYNLLIGKGFGFREPDVYYSSHNTILRAIHNIGLLGSIFFFISIFLYIFYNSNKKSKLINYLPIVTIFFVAMIEDLFFDFKATFYLILIASCFWKEEEKKYDS